MSRRVAVAALVIAPLLAGLLSACGEGTAGSDLVVGPPVTGEGDDPDAQSLFEVLSLASFPGLYGSAIDQNEEYTPNPTAPQQMADLINQLRCENGVHPLAVNRQLNSAAVNYSLYMAGERAISGNGGPGALITQSGYLRDGPWGMNVCAGFEESVQPFFDAWVAYGSQTMMLNPTWREVGVGLITGEASGLSYITVFYSSPAGPDPTITCEELGY